MGENHERHLDEAIEDLIQKRVRLAEFEKDKEIQKLQGALDTLAEGGCIDYTTSRNYGSGYETTYRHFRSNDTSINQTIWDIRDSISNEQVAITDRIVKGYKDMEKDLRSKLKKERDGLKIPWYFGLFRRRINL